MTLLKSIPVNILELKCRDARLPGSKIYDMIKRGYDRYGWKSRFRIIRNSKHRTLMACTPCMYSVFSGTLGAYPKFGFKDVVALFPAQVGRRRMKCAGWSCCACLVACLHPAHFTPFSAAHFADVIRAAKCGPICINPQAGSVAGWMEERDECDEWGARRMERGCLYRMSTQRRYTK